MNYPTPQLPVNVAVVRIVGLVLAIDRPTARFVAVKGAETYGDTIPQGFLYASRGEALSASLKRIVLEQAGVELSTDGVVLSVSSSPRRGDTRSTLTVTMVGVTASSESAYTLAADETKNALIAEHHEVVRAGIETLSGRLLRDPETTYQLLGNVVTNRAAVSVLGGLGVRSEIALARLSRSALYRPSSPSITDDPEADPNDPRRAFYRARPRQVGAPPR